MISIAVLERISPALTSAFAVVVEETGMLVQPNAEQAIVTQVFREYMPVMHEKRPFAVPGR